MEAVTTALTAGISSIASEALSAIAVVVPAALPIAGAIIVVCTGLRTFRTVSGGRG